MYGTERKLVIGCGTALKALRRLLAVMGRVEG
jgi:hypothetical protein